MSEEKEERRLPGLVRMSDGDITGKRPELSPTFTPWILLLRPQCEAVTSLNLHLTSFALPEEKAFGEASM